MEGAKGIEPIPGFLDRANGFAARGAPSTITPGKCLDKACGPNGKRYYMENSGNTERDCVFRSDPVPTNHG